MNATTLGLGSGIALGLAAAFGGFGAFLTVLVLGALGCWPSASSTCPSSPTGTRAEDHQPTALGQRTPSFTS